MKTIITQGLPIVDQYTYLISTIAPRPIALVSTIDKAGNVNLAPFSYFNIFGVNPPIVAFSAALSGKTALPKDTLHNLREVGEAVINLVNYDMVHAASLSSVAYPLEVNEFVKAGFTAIPSEQVRPPRVAESPVQLECRMVDIIALGEQGGAGNLILCHVDRIHIAEHVLTAEGKINHLALDLVARAGGNYYCRMNENSMFEVPKPLHSFAIGVDLLPETIRHSHILTGNDLAQLASVEQLPTPEQLADLVVPDYSKDNLTERHTIARQLLAKNEKMKAWKVLLD
ncbi:MAG: flavin reductase family protein [Chitinophagales bacterium]|jgi:flavin reductase (DIM6/NTAB) family NADH-FMN oxidoreductase RutF|nr:flavin reductase family protein [Chitinophagales bacterium]HNI44937.1 flavin reductase family protein [Chitinophagales bacterium]